MKLLKCYQGDKYLSAVSKNQDGEVNQLGKFSNFSNSSFSGEGIIMLVKA